MLTKRQKQVLDFIKTYKNKHDYAPSLEEIKKHLHLSAVSTVHYHVQTLQSMGYLQKEVNQPRTLDVFSKQKLIHIPLLGIIAAGQPIEAIEQKENIAVPQSSIKPGNNYFALRVNGESMREENINNGDIVIIKQQSTADNGQKVVALINNNEVTLKKIYREKDKIRLEPANPEFKSILVEPDNLKIQGIVTDIIKSYTKNIAEETIIEKTPDLNIDQKVDIVKSRNRIVNHFNDLSASEWIQETISVFVQKGLGAGHKDAQIERQHPAPFSFQDVARFIKFFTKTGQTVLDPFCGVASTLKAAALNNRNGVGIELVKKYCDLGKKRLETEVEFNLFNKSKQTIINGDAFEKINKFSDNYFDFIITSPPYWNILNKIDHKALQERVHNGLDTKYSNDKRDIANIPNYHDFLTKLSQFFESCSRILKPNKYLCVVVSDFRQKAKYYSFHSDLANLLEKKYYTLKGITILYQNHKKVFPYGYPFTYVPNIHHQYILILQNHAKNK
ncbi:MAG: transcriptional repressor LexA [Candidatus Omnitrophica bacterium]|nr:transcriptional repressor LexA [Candidatus Omnitrophota bacterium]